MLDGKLTELMIHLEGFYYKNEYYHKNMVFQLQEVNASLQKA